MRAPASRGVVWIRAAAPVLDALVAHVERRARATDRPSMVSHGSVVDEPWREAAARLGASSDVLADPAEIAEFLTSNMGDGLLVVREEGASSFSREVASALLGAGAMDDKPGLLLVLSEDAHGASSSGARGERVFEVDPELSPQEMRCFWEAVASDASLRLSRSMSRLDVMHRWWSSVRAVSAEALPAADATSDAAGRLLARLTLARCSLRRNDVALLGDSAALHELLEAGLTDADEAGFIHVAHDVRRRARSSEATGSDRAEVAEILHRRGDAWSILRAGELFAAAGRVDRAEACFTRAIGALSDRAARDEAWLRYDRVIAALDEGSAAPLLRRAADLSLRLGDAERAQSLARTVAARAGDAFDVLLTLGRASRARGDLTTAAIALGRAMDAAPDGDAKGRACVELADVRFRSGDFDGAAREANGALGMTSSPGVRLDARNVLGKIHLSSGAWASAEEHFASDACEAALAGDIVSELRARLNHAIALLQSGRMDDARAMLEGVLSDGERHDEPRAVAFALTNLTTIAARKHDYAEAFRLGERAFAMRHKQGDKLSLAHIIAIIAELRLMVGQIEEAEHALAFGRKACGPTIAGTRAAHFAMIGARIQLARGDTIAAATALDAAQKGLGSSDDGDGIAEAHALCARVALEEGAVARARQALSLAEETACSPRAHAENALLAALTSRAAGEPFAAEAQRALDLARESQDKELAREAHVLLHYAALFADDARAARTHLDAAVQLREGLASGLTDPMRARFLARRELVELAKLELSSSSVARPDDPRRIALETIDAPWSSASASAGPESAAPSQRRTSYAPPSMPAISERRAAAKGSIVGKDPAVIALLHAIQRVGPSDATVLIRGESGTGKELVAEALHEASGRRAASLVKVNCAALVETLLLSELFGHEKGSFTGASARKRGRFEMAEGGTLFLDEIGDISPRTQVALLRVLQEKTFERVGGVTPIRADVRIVCATHRDLKAMVARGEFREDLYYRLRGVVLEVPALRYRLGDLGAIASAILAKIAAERGGAQKRLSARALTVLARHPWPGNIRELENALHAAALFAEGDEIDAADVTNNVEGLRGLAETVAAPDASNVAEKLPLKVIDEPVCDGSSVANGTPAASANNAVSRASGNEQASEPGSSPTDVAYAHIRTGVSLGDLKRQIERDCIARALAEANGNITRAATLLGMKRPRMSQLVKQYGFGSDGACADMDAAESEES